MFIPKCKQDTSTKHSPRSKTRGPPRLPRVIRSIRCRPCPPSPPEATLHIYAIKTTFLHQHHHGYSSTTRFGRGHAIGTIGVLRKVFAATQCTIDVRSFNPSKGPTSRYENLRNRPTCDVRQIRENCPTWTMILLSRATARHVIYFQSRIKIATALTTAAPISARATPAVLPGVKLSVLARTLNKYAKRAVEWEMMVLLVMLWKVEIRREEIEKNGRREYRSKREHRRGRRSGNARMRPVNLVVVWCIVSCCYTRRHAHELKKYNKDIKRFSLSSSARRSTFGGKMDRSIHVHSVTLYCALLISDGGLRCCCILQGTTRMLRMQTW